MHIKDFKEVGSLLSKFNTTKHRLADLERGDEIEITFARSGIPIPTRPSDAALLRPLAEGMLRRELDYLRDKLTSLGVNCDDGPEPAE